MGLEVKTKAVTFQPTLKRSQTDEIIESGAYSVSIANVSSANVSKITGADGVEADLKPGEVINFSASESNGTIGRISVDNTTTSSETLIIVLRK